MKNDLIREFKTGANRNNNTDKRDIEGFISPIVLKIYSDYMHENRFLVDGTFRDSDNWQKGIPNDVYYKCMIRHVNDLWLSHRGYKSRHNFIDSACAVMFNVMGLIYEYVKEHPELENFEDEEK